jgi:hypothetical protein
MDAIEERHRSRVALLESAARGGSLQRKTHLDVGRAKLVAGKP